MTNLIIFIVLLGVVCGLAYYSRTYGHTNTNELESSAFETPLEHILVDEPHSVELDDDVVATSLPFDFGEVKLVEPLYDYDVENVDHLKELNDFVGNNTFGGESTYILQDPVGVHTFQVVTDVIPTFEGNDVHYEESSDSVAEVIEDDTTSTNNVEDAEEITLPIKD